MTDVYAADWVLPVAGPPIEHGAVAVEGSRIVAVGESADVDGDERHEHPGCAIIPGFVNAHSHLEYAVYAGFGDGLSFGEWLALHIARKQRLAWDEMVAIARLGAADCLASGITTVADSSFSGAAAVAADELGLRAVVHLEVFGGADELETRFEPNRRRIERSLSERVRLGVSPHAPYSASLELYRACLELDLPLATHVAESPAERQWMLAGAGAWAEIAHLLQPSPGQTSVRVLAAAGLLNAGTTAAHCVVIDAAEIELLAEHDVAVAHCPRSNALLGCGVAPVAALLRAGVRVGLGTDSPASTPSFDMFDEMRAAVMLARAAGVDASLLTPSEALRLATLGAAAALGLDDEIGSLVPGKRADLAVVSLAGSPYHPWEHPAAAVVLGGTPERVWRTIVDGSTRYERGGTGWHELRRNAAAARARMLASVPAPSSP